MFILVGITFLLCVNSYRWTLDSQHYGAWQQEHNQIVTDMHEASVGTREDNH